MKAHLLKDARASVHLWGFSFFGGGAVVVDLSPSLSFSPFFFSSRLSLFLGDVGTFLPSVAGGLS